MVNTRLAKKYSLHSSHTRDSMSLLKTNYLPMNRKLQIRDVTLRDGQQSLFATRMKQSQIERVLPIYKEAGF